MERGKHFSMIRGFHIADWFTLANAFCGVAAVFASMSYLQNNETSRILLACGLVAAALVFDVLDGRIARWRQESSTLGRELDSLADVISFGVAPAAIAYGAGMQSMWDCIVLLYFVGCGVSRLARFNITAASLSEGTGKVKYFEGTPIPTSLVLVVVIAVATWNNAIGERLWLGAIELGPWLLHPLVGLFALSGSLMIS